MISVEEAKDLILKHVNFHSEITEIKVENALNYKLADSIFSPIDLPSFNQSNVDGYAVYGIENTNSWIVKEEVKAGDFTAQKLKTGECFRIFTGAFVPEGVDAILMQEHVNRYENEINLKNGFEILLGQQIRKKASQIKKDSLALEKGKILNPASLSFLNMLGISSIKVYKKPRISLIVTGNELQFAGEVLENGKVFEANSIAINSVLEQNNYCELETVFVKDDIQSLKNVFQTCLSQSDFILFSGGISVGDYDFVKEVNEELGTKCIFHKIAQKPGKPLYFGKNEDKYIFALPGNPASALTCMYEYVLPALRIFTGKEEIFPKSKQLKISKDFSKKAGLANFLKGKYHNDEVEILEGQDSFIMKSFSEANCLVFLPSHIETIKKGELVEIHIL